MLLRHATCAFALALLATPTAAGAAPSTWQYVKVNSRDIDGRAVAGGNVTYTATADERGGRVTVRVRGGPSCAPIQEFTYTWRFDRDIRTVSLEDGFNVHVATTARRGSCTVASNPDWVDHVYVGTSDTHTAPPNTESAAAGIGAHLAYATVRGGGVDVYPAGRPDREGLPSATVPMRLKDQGHLPDAATVGYLLSVEVFAGGFNYQAVYVYRRGAGVPAPPPATVRSGAWRYLKVNGRDIDGRAVGAGNVTYTASADVRGGSVTVHVKGGPPCAVSGQDFTYAWTFDRDISALNLEDAFNVAVTTTARRGSCTVTGEPDWVDHVYVGTSDTHTAPPNAEAATRGIAAHLAYAAVASGGVSLYPAGRPDREGPPSGTVPMRLKDTHHVPDQATVGYVLAVEVFTGGFNYQAVYVYEKAGRR